MTAESMDLKSAPRVSVRNAGTSHPVAIPILPYRLPPRPMAPHPGRGTDGATCQSQAQTDEPAAAAKEKRRALEAESLEVLVDIVNKCNLRCVMCHFSFDEVFYQRSRLMLPEKFEEIAANIRPFTRKLTLSAAYEPTVSPHFAAILRIAKKYSFPELTFTTNGNAMPESLAECIVDSLVTEVCVSVHAARSETYAHILRGGSLDRVVQNVQRLLNVRNSKGNGRTPRIQFNIALMRSNLPELVEIIELAAQLGVDSVAFRHVIVFEGLDMESESLAHYDKRLVNNCIRHALERAHELGVTIHNSPDYFQVEGEDAHAQCAEWDASFNRPSVGRALLRRVRSHLNRIALRTPVLSSALIRHLDVRPFGNIDGHPETLQFHGDAMELTGWALSTAGVDKLHIMREPICGDTQSSLGRLRLIPIGTARFHNSTRLDVMRDYPRLPFVYRAGWTYALSRAAIPEVATDIVIHAVAIARNGVRRSIAKRNVTLRTGTGLTSFIRCHKPFNSLYIDSGALVYPHSDCHTDQPFGSFVGQPFTEVWHDGRLENLRVAMETGHPPEMCIRCPLFINRDVDTEHMFEPHADFSREDRR
jgi:molybdenum cofactor biosynthesis enzyme MoaA